MKKILFTLSLFAALGAGAQNMRLNAYALYAFDDAVDSYYSNTSYFNGTVKGGLIWGGGLEFMLHPEYGLELTYLRMDTEAPMEYYSTQPPAGVKSSVLDVDINYALIGGNRYKAFGPNVEGFGGMQLGAAFVKATRPANSIVGEASDNATKFAWAIRGGANIFPGGKASKVGLKLSIGLMSMVQGAGGGLYFGTGGAGAGISTYSSILQFNMGGGLVFKFGK
jgi:hypothetical protein